MDDIDNNKKDHPLKDEQVSHEAILSKNDTMKVLTPFAFKIDQSLFGLSLATPSRRLIALLVDLFIVALLSDAPGELLAIFLSITFYRVSKTQFFEKMNPENKTTGRKRRRLARWLSAICLFIALMSILPAIIDPYNNNVDEPAVNTEPLLAADKELSAEQAIVFTATTASVAATIKNSDCMTLSCWQEEIPPKLDLLAGIPFKPSVLESLYGELTQHTILKEENKEQLTQYLINYHKEHLLPDETLTQSQLLETEPASEQAPNVSVAEPQVNNEGKPVYSIVKYAEALIQDLGLGFGWAAFYFTVFTSAWRGQTPGKKLLGIRVIQLDGTPLSLWDSFGRYGGYGAGIATGMLGFLQVFWDSNRQAIHDKISATVVIDHVRDEPASKVASQPEPIDKKQEQKNENH
ncbi:RDD domain protein [Thalassotalea loyana]|uniref:RDD domain protein n=1 Tax=Thalassotalea loyana TaxID=280483 RepID=A0ABQ6HIG7_9GAMM|nr:RDD family protein [Thalassotalea loyana]GLX86582.1 RDD domain protein [Thalassotalea loyana]